VTGTARYLYAVCRGLDDTAVEDARGLRDGPLSLVHHQGLDAVTSDVPLEEFDEAGLSQHLEDLVWLEEVARTHDDVVRRVAAHAPTAPLRLATVFHDEEGVRRRVEEWHAPLVEVLDRIDGRAEWSVKVLVGGTPPRAAAPAAEPATGTEFLRRRREQVADQAAQEDFAVRLAESVHHQLAAMAEASRLLPPQDPQLTGRPETMALNGAYLVPRAEEERFTTVVEDLRQHHTELVIEVGGPWPAYSFAVLEPS
jgi:hypothetical protein